MKFIKYTSILIVLLLSTQLQGQNDVAGPISPQNSAKDSLYALINLARSISTEAPEEALNHVEEALKISFRIKNKRGEAYCYTTLGALNYQLSRYKSAEEFYKKALPLLNAIADDEGIYETYKYLASTLEAQESWNESLEYYLIFLNKARALNRAEDILSTQRSMARVYFNQGKYDLAKTRFEEVLQLTDSISDQSGLLETYDYLGKVHMALKDTTKALEYYQKSGKVALTTGNTDALNLSYGNIRNTLNSQGNYDEGLLYQQQTQTWNADNGTKRQQNRANIDLANQYLLQADGASAIPYLKNTISIATTIGALEDKSEALEVLSNAYVTTGEYDKALESYKQYVKVTDSLLNKREEELNAALTLAQNLNEKEKRIETLEKDQSLREQQIQLLETEQQVQVEQIKFQQAISYALIGGLLLLAIAGLLILRSSRQKRKANLLLALQSLRSQMNPHFIFNSLNSVNSFISMNDERSANKFLADFSRLMRMVMENSKHDFVPLSVELQVLELYLRLEHFRFKDKFDYSFEIDDAISRDQVEVPPMLIQPYIENAVWHGLRYKEDKGFLQVKFFLNNNRINVIIEDDGIGRKRSQELKTKNQKEAISTGMKNIDERLKIINILHRTQLKVSVQDVVKEESVAGTRVVLELPHVNTEIAA